MHSRKLRALGLLGAATGLFALALGGTAGAAPTAAQFEKVPTKILITQPLPKAPPHKSAAFIVEAIAGAQPFVNGFTSAMKALGWTAYVDQYNPATGSPETSFQQALLQNPDYIVLDTVPPNLITQGLQTAEQRHIPIIGNSEYVNGTSLAGNKDYYSTTGNSAELAEGNLIANFVIARHSKPIHALVVNTPAAGGNEVLYAKGMTDALARCSSCTSASLNVPITALVSGSVPSEVTAYIQSHPSINVVMDTYSTLDDGVASSLKSVGLLKNVDLSGNYGDIPQIKGIAAGTEYAWTTYPPGYALWTTADTMARLSLGLSPSPQRGELPAFVMVKSNIGPILKSGTTWDGPAGYQNQFKALWHK